MSDVSPGVGIGGLFPIGDHVSALSRAFSAIIEAQKSAISLRTNTNFVPRGFALGKASGLASQSLAASKAKAMPQFGCLRLARKQL